MPKPATIFDWDVFLSYASEDKRQVRELADRLRECGLRIWLDDPEIQVGDSIRDKIDEGLARSAFGVVFISKCFLRKRWPRQELNAIVSADVAGRSRVLPVWIDVEPEDVAAVSPILADRKAALWMNGGAEVVAEVVLQAIRPYLAPSLTARLEAAIDTSDVAQVLKLVRAQPLIVRSLVRGAGWGRPTVLLGTRVKGTAVDVMTRALRSTAGNFEYEYFLFGPISNAFDGPHPSETLRARLDDAHRLVRALRKMKPRRNRPDHHSVVVVAGRRPMVRMGAVGLCGEGFTVRSYDMLLDAVNELTK